MKTDHLFRTLKTVLVFLAGIFVMACGEEKPDNPEPGPEPVATDNYRAYTEKNDQTDVKMSEETIFVKDKLSEDFESYNANTGTITFRNSELLKNQEIKVGDILYSTDRTEKTPNGYCLRVVSIKESGGMVTYETEPATALEAIDYLNESGVLSAGNYKPEDIRVFALPDDDGGAETRGFKWDDASIEIKGDKMEFHSDWESTRFSYILFEDKDHSDNLKSSLKIKVTLELQHELDSEKSNIMFDYGKFVLFTMFKVGVSAKFEIGTSLALEGNQDSLLSKEQERIAKERLIGKKFKIAEIPLNFTCSKVIVDPKFIVYGEFKLDLSGKLVLEAGIKDGYYSLNVENKGYFIPEFIEYSYLRRVTHFHPYMHMEGTLGFTAMAGFGVGINFEIPSFPVITRDEGNIDSKLTEPSAIGVYFGAELTEDINVVMEADFFSGNREFRIEGRNGGLNLTASIEGKIGLRKKVFAELDWTFWENEIIELPDWDWKIYTWTPTPYDLTADVNNDDATVALSWKVPDRNGLFNTSTVNIGNANYGEVFLAPFAANLEERFISYGPAQDGTYYWNVTTHALDGGAFPSDTCSFVIDASTVTTGEPIMDEGMISVPVEINTLNHIRQRGVVYSTVREEPLADVDKESHYDGEETSFDQVLTNLQPSKTYYARGYALISYDGGSKYIYGNSVTFKTGTNPDNPSELTPWLSIDPDVIEFGEVYIGKTKSASLEIRNDGDDDLTYWIVSPDDSPFSAYPTEIKTLAPGDSQEVTVYFSPDKTGEVSGAFIVKSNDPRGDDYFVAKGIGSEEYIPITDIVFDPDEVILGRGDYYSFNIRVLPDNATDRQTVYNNYSWYKYDYQWTISDESVITSDSWREHFRAVGAGTATVSARLSYWNHKTYETDYFYPTCHITVVVYIDKLYIVDGDEVWGYLYRPCPKSLIVGESQSFKVKYEPEDATETDLIWKSDDPSIATVSANGVVKAYKPGKTTIRCMVATEARGHIEVDWDLEVEYPSGSHEGFNGEYWD
ncbi:MAG: Ig-like domain-containing protein [Bacteroidales bacterium]|nr:Ig-like domain-containing protein [Bacteroidales bacterium]